MHNFQSKVTIAMKCGALRMYVNSDVNVSVGELTVMYTGIATDCAAEQNLHTVADSNVYRYCD